MFHAADTIEQVEEVVEARAGSQLRSSALSRYVAADVWTRKSEEEWGLGKIFRAFQTSIDFVTQLLEIASTHCSM